MRSSLAPAVLWALAAPCAAPCAAQPVQPNELARAIELAGDPALPIQAFTLPAELLSRLLDPELGDLCVFAPGARQLAHAVVTPRDSDAELVELPVAFFPLETRERTATGAVEVSVERDARGAITRAFREPRIETNTRLVGYLLELETGERPVAGLALALRAERAFTLTAQVEASDDLDTFRPLTSATLAQLAHEGHTLRRDLIALPNTRARFLRLSFRDPPSGLALDAVHAHVLQSAAQQARRFVELPARALPAREGQLFLYELKGAFRPDRYGVALPGATVLIEAALESGPSAEGPFHELDRGLFRRAGGEDGGRAAGERALPSTRDRFFRLRVTPKGGGVREGAPSLRLGYAAPRVLFASDGAGPYLLAYGSARARCRQFSDAELKSLSARELPRADTARALRTRALGGDQALRPPAPPRSTRVYVLWAVLIAAVAGLGLVARKLLRSV